MSRNLKKIIVVFCITIGLIGIAGLLSHGTEDSTETVEVVSEKILIPGGQSVGIRMNVKGVLVVGLEEIETEDSIVSPGYEAGIEIGDMIPPELYGVVAEILVFVDECDRIRGKIKH